MDDEVEAFRKFLEAKLSIDDRSLNKAIFDPFLAYIRSARAPSILDIGTGTGAMLRRIVKAGVPPNTRLIGLDPDGRLLQTAQHAIAELLSREGYRVSQSTFRVTGENAGGKLSVRLIVGDILDPSLPEVLGRGKFDAVTANALMDILPTADALTVVSGLLTRPSGLFYATINYDGLTDFLPLYADRDFEAKLWEVYNRSMDERRVGGRKTGDSRGGSVLFSEAIRLGFEIFGYGSSDWCVHPIKREYTKDEERFLDGLLAIVYEEERRHPEIETRRLEEWYSQRRRQLRNASLSLMVHQTDLLARRPAGS